MAPGSSAIIGVVMQPRAAEGKMAPHLGSAWARCGKLCVSCVTLQRHSTGVYNAIVYRVVGTVHTCFSELPGMMMVGAGNVPVYLLVAFLLRGPRALAKSKSSSEIVLFRRALLGPAGKSVSRRTRSL